MYNLTRKKILIFSKKLGFSRKRKKKAQRKLAKTVLSRIRDGIRDFNKQKISLYQGCSGLRPFFGKKALDY